MNRLESRISRLEQESQDAKIRITAEVVVIDEDTELLPQEGRKDRDGPVTVIRIGGPDGVKVTEFN